jgi:hypothetical protein
MQNKLFDISLGSDSYLFFHGTLSFDFSCPNDIGATHMVSMDSILQLVNDSYEYEVNKIL